MTPDLHRVLDPAYLAGIIDVPVEELRRMRSECTDLENAVSYARRMAQGRLDLVAAEAGRRAEGGGGDLADLVASLPEVLANGVRAEASGRLSEELDPSEELVAPLTDLLDEVVAPSVVSSLTDLPDDRVSTAAEALRRFEDDLSSSRRALHTTIDSLNEELARRIAAGETAPPTA